MARYFSPQPPERPDGAVLLRVRISSIEGNVVSADLDGRFARLSADGRVRIELELSPSRGSCIELGTTVGPVFVTGTLMRYRSGALVLRAMPSDPPRVHPLRITDAERNQYVVDPRYLLPGRSSPPHERAKR